MISASFGEVSGNKYLWHGHRVLSKGDPVLLKSVSDLGERPSVFIVVIRVRLCSPDLWFLLWFLSYLSSKVLSQLPIYFSPRDTKVNKLLQKVSNDPSSWSLFRPCCLIVTMSTISRLLLKLRSLFKACIIHCDPTCKGTAVQGWIIFLQWVYSVYFSLTYWSD